MERDHEGKFLKGNKEGGRPKGSKNKALTELRELVNDLIEMNWETIQEDIDQLDPSERVNVIIKLLEFSIPKLQRTNVVEEHPEQIQINFVNYADTVKSLDNDKPDKT